MNEIKNYGTYRNQYGKLVTDRGPSQGQVNLIAKLLGEKILPTHGGLAQLIDEFYANDLSGQNARVLIDSLFQAKSEVVAPSTLGPQEAGKPASDKQLNWVQKLRSEKAVPESEDEAIGGFVTEGLTGRHAGRILDYLFGLPRFDAPAPAQGFVGQLGEDIQVEGVLSTFRTIPSKFGETNLIVVTLDDGRQVKAFSNAKSFWGLEEGQRIGIAGEVKSHEEYHGSEATVLKRPQAFLVETEALDWTITPPSAPVTVEESTPAPEKGEDILGYWGLN